MQKNRTTSNFPDSLPLNAKMVFKGKIFEVWQWDQKMFDGSVEIFERLKRPDTAQVIPIVGDKILIQEQEQPDKPYSFTSIPGGRCEEGESSLAAAKRELLEETGYVSDNWLLWREEQPVEKIIWTVYIYVARNCRREKSPALDAGEKIKTKLIGFDDFLLLADNPLFYERELKCELIRARFDKKNREEFKNFLFKR